MGTGAGTGTGTGGDWGIISLHRDCLGSIFSPLGHEGRGYVQRVVTDLISPGSTLKRVRLVLSTLTQLPSSSPRVGNLLGSGRGVKLAVGPGRVEQWISVGY